MLLNSYERSVKASAINFIRFGFLLCDLNKLKFRPNAQQLNKLATRITIAPSTQTIKAIVWV